MSRLFIAIEPPSEIKSQLLSLMDGVDSARWQSAAQLHLTLRFVGDVEDQGIITAALRGLDVPRFDLALSGIGVFDKRGRAHTLWAGVAPRAPLERLQQAVEQAVVGAGIPPEEHPYQPHITLARLNGTAVGIETFLERHSELMSPPFPVDDVCLYESKLTSEGGVYTVRERFSLK